MVDQRREKIVATTAGKKRINVIAILNAQTLKPVTTFPETVNSETLGEHSVWLRRSYPRTKFSTLHIILDQGSCGVSKATQIVAARLGIKLRQFLPYSPNLNLIERAWKVMNEQVRDNVYFLNRWSNLSRSLTTRFTDNFQVIQQPAF